MQIKVTDNIVTFEFKNKSKGEWTKEYEIIKEPVPHILINSKKEIHGWYNSSKPNDKRACTAERFMLNPYNGCGWNCCFCYAQCLWGFFKLFLDYKIITVFKDFDQIVKNQLSRLKVASCGYLSPITDPFQPINSKYKLIEKIIETFLEFNLPTEIITKGRISDHAIKLLSEQKYNHSFGQVTILTLDDGVRKQLILNSGANTEVLLSNIRRLTDNNLYAVCRIDPIIPYLTDDLKSLEEIIISVKDLGAKHIIVSCLDIPKFIKDPILKALENIESGLSQKINDLYLEEMSGDLHANINYRRNLFGRIKSICDKVGISMATCMEFEVKRENGKLNYFNLNKEFMTSINCEGMNVPIYRRTTLEKKFSPINCKGNCLTCDEKVLPCEIPELKEARNWKLKDYKKWSKIIRIENKIEHFTKIQNEIKA